MSNLKGWLDPMKEDTGDSGPRSGQIRHVLILGCGRSGTSIFGELFDQLNGYTYHCEPPFGELFGYDYSRPVAVKVPKECPDFPASPGLSFPLEELRCVIAAPLQIFWIVRHPLDAVCSLRVGIAQNWGHHPKPPDWRGWRTRPLIEQCAHHWNYINSEGYRQVREMAHVVRFEDMVREPELFARAICRDVGLDLAGPGSSIKQWASRVQDSNNERFVEAECSKNYSRPDHRVRIGRWKENLSQNDVRAVFAIVHETAAQFHYRLDENG